VGLTYSINGGTYQTSTTFGGLAAGSYAVTVKNSSGCTSQSQSAVITAVQVPNPPVVSTTQPTCSIQTGSITITSPIGTGFTYSVNGGTYQSGTTFSNLAPGSYAVIVKNASGCVSSPTNVTLTLPTNCDVAGNYPTATTCNNFLTGTTKLTEVCYSVTRSKISNATPGVFFYYVKVIAPSTTFTVNINQVSQTAGFPLFVVQTSSNISQIFLWDQNCTKRATGVQTSTGQASVTMNGAIVGATYVVSVKYDSKSILNTPVGSPPPIASYNFTTQVNGSTVPNSSITLLVKPTNCVVLRTTDSEPFVGISPVAYPNPTNGLIHLDYEMENDGLFGVYLFNMTGQLVYRKDLIQEVVGSHHLEIDLRAAGLESGLYMMRVIRNDSQNDLRILIVD
jgi:uncharacterized protein (DUF2141 family)